MKHSEWLKYCQENEVTDTNVLMPHDGSKKMIEFRLDGRLKRFVLEDEDEG